jgi:ABC-type uncharacterized transport system involved in gliding motility auxiliary subunit
MKFLDNFKNFNRIKIFNGFLQVLLIVTLFLGLQYVLNHAYVRVDFSDDQCNTLSTETQSFLATFQHSIDLIVLTNESHTHGNFLKQMTRLADAYRAFMAHKTSLKFNFKIIDTLRNPQETLSVKKRYDLSENEGIILAVGSKFKFLHEDDFYRKTEIQSQFLGEHVLTNNLLDLTQNRPKIIYWILGHKEYNFKDIHGNKGASLAGQTLRQHNFEVRPLENCLSIPQDASMLVIAGPQLPYLEEECDTLKTYLFQKHGRLLICLHPIYEHGLEMLLNALGLKDDGQLLLDDGKDFLSSQGDLIIRRLTQHEITQPLIQHNLGLIFGLTRPITLDPNGNISYCTQLLHSAETSWLRQLVSTDSLSFNAQQDVRCSHTLACLFDNTPKTNFNVQLSNSKAIIVGCADWLSNEKILSLGNRWFFLNCFKWALGNEYAFLLNPLPLNTYTLALSQQKLLLLCLNFLILPFIFCLLGIVIYTVRKE